ncbi:transmembrane protein [Heterostelium album PN500]|uniref:Transmembrane protein n=1 Tax=Heterostelium pallidum (strain ATCC 26659 / Pp 5 / PN500) TaxID=670386 RepID=D3B3R7_HETP5|nr:transmembrane protein [Heterostelium album PN500]EFA83965.1 transmembrane protein [Heterostelium album PN500]|eukprot:XP_020436082.1 transmembrane protein [Heterostelium album PN500]
MSKTNVKSLSETQIKNRITLLEKRKENRKNVRLFFHPIKTIKYFLIVIKDMIASSLSFFKERPKTLFFSSLLISLSILAIYAPGEHQNYIGKYSEFISICLWWVGLGVLSSVGLGTGLHTFVLYLGPHIAKVTLAASEWQSVDFLQYGPNSFVNPNAPQAGGVTFWQILNSIQLAALMWGAGTAIGELPPYFVARTARIKGLKLEQEEAKKGIKKEEKQEKQSLIQRMTAAIPAMIGNMGFFGILAFASIPNPLFDLAGITCGHCLVPFWKFFGATLIGKAVIKAHIQACFVILAFNMETLTKVVTLIENYIPWSKGKIQPILEKERDRLNSSSNLNKNAPKSFVGVIWDCVLACMIFYFLISIIDSSVQEYLIEKDNKKIEELEAALKKNESKKDK